MRALHCFNLHTSYTFTLCSSKHYLFQLSSVAESRGLYDDEQGSATAIVSLATGWRVWVVEEMRGGSSLYGEDIERVTSFTGALLYETEEGPAVIG